MRVAANAIATANAVMEKRITRRVYTPVSNVSCEHDSESGFSDPSGPDTRSPRSLDSVKGGTIPHVRIPVPAPAQPGDSTLYGPRV